MGSLSSVFLERTIANRLSAFFLSYAVVAFNWMLTRQLGNCLSILSISCTRLIFSISWISWLRNLARLNAFSKRDVGKNNCVALQRNLPKTFSRKYQGERLEGRQVNILLHKPLMGVPLVEAFFVPSFLAPRRRSGCCGSSLSASDCLCFRAAGFRNDLLLRRAFSVDRKSPSVPEITTADAWKSRFKWRIWVHYSSF